LAKTARRLVLGTIDAALDLVGALRVFLFVEVQPVAELLPTLYGGAALSPNAVITSGRAAPCS
jgi:hypothetical protein